MLFRVETICNVGFSDLIGRLQGPGVVSVAPLKEGIE